MDHCPVLVSSSILIRLGTTRVHDFFAFYLTLNDSVCNYFSTVPIIRATTVRNVEWLCGNVVSSLSAIRFTLRFFPQLQASSAPVRSEEYAVIPSADTIGKLDTLKMNRRSGSGSKLSPSHEPPKEPAPLPPESPDGETVRVSLLWVKRSR